MNAKTAFIPAAIATAVPTAPAEEIQAAMQSYKRKKAKRKKRK